MSEALPWVWLVTLPGLLATGSLNRLRPGLASLPGPALVGLAGLWGLLGERSVETRLTGWLPFLPDGTLHLRFDPLAALMLAVLGFVALAVYMYSLGYMAGDPGQRRFFAYLDFFVAAMALLVLAGNLAVLLIGWAGVGLASFLLISFWRDRPGTLRAGLEALAANAVGDAGLLLAAVLVPAGCGDLLRLQEAGCLPPVGGAELLAGLLVLAAAAKSAQGPFYFWLPSAMAGPTPISALIHAATMVAAGVYLLVRVFGLLALAPTVLFWTAVLGVGTALLGGLASLAQANFKRGLAFSTVSQLGYMIAAVGLLAPFAAIFHLMTHASMKALLFLCAGVVIHAVGGEEDCARLGGLRRQLLWSYWGFWIGALALIGLPGTAGSFSKDALIEAGLTSSPLLGQLLLGGSLISGLYIGRLLFSVYHGPNRGASMHHQPSALLVGPLIPLALGALVLGFAEWPAAWLSTALAGTVPHPDISGAAAVSPAGLAAAGLGLAGLVLAWLWVRYIGWTGAAGLESRWVNVLARGGAGAAAWLAGLHGGYLASYVLASVLALAALLAFAVQP